MGVILLYSGPVCYILPINLKKSKTINQNKQNFFKNICILSLPHFITDFKNFGPWWQPTNIFVGSTYYSKTMFVEVTQCHMLFSFRILFFFLSSSFFFKLSWSYATLKVCLLPWVSPHHLDVRLWGGMWSLRCLADLSRKLDKSHCCIPARSWHLMGVIQENDYKYSFLAVQKILASSGIQLQPKD